MIIYLVEEMLFMKKEDLLKELEEEREHFLDAIEGLSDEDLEKPGVMDDWSIKDLLAHLTMWEAELIKLLWQAKQGQKPSSIHFSHIAVDELNARWKSEMQDRSLERVMADFQSVRNQTIRRVEAFSDKDLNDEKRYNWLGGRPLWEWIAGNSFEHEAEHLEQIVTWRNREGL
jgi:hypothetical protein